MININDPKRIKKFTVEEVEELSTLLYKISNKHVETRKELMKLLYVKSISVEEKKNLSEKVTELDRLYVEKIRRLGGRVMMNHLVVRFESSDGFIFWDGTRGVVEKLLW